MSATDVHGADSITFLYLNVSTSNSDLASGCYVSVEPSLSLGDQVRVSQAGGGWSDSITITGSGSASVENARCRVFSQGSSVTRNGNTLTVNLNITFKPGFIGQFNTYMRAYNQQTAYSDWVTMGTWDLSSNVTDSAPALTVESPANGATVQGTFNITGWALDNSTRRENKVTAVNVLIDGQPLISATRYARPDVCTGLNADRMDCPNAGFTASWNTGSVSNGSHTITVTATDNDYSPHTTDPPVTRTVTVNNDSGAVLSISPTVAYVRQRYNWPTPAAIEQQQFAAALSGFPPPTDVLWSVSAPPPNNAGEISSTGLYTSGSYQLGNPGTQVTVTGTRSSNPAQTANATAVMVGVMTCGGTTTPGVAGATPTWYCAASVPLTNFTLTPAVGYVDQYNYYHPPASNSTQQTVLMEARSAYDTSIRYRLQMTIYTH